MSPIESSCTVEGIGLQDHVDKLLSRMATPLLEPQMGLGSAQGVSRGGYERSIRETSSNTEDS